MGFKLKTRTMFPALVTVQSPLTLIKSGLQYTFGVDASQGALGPAGPGYGGTSTTSLAIGTGSKSFTTQVGYAYLPGNYVRASSAADGTNYMEGTITSYAPIGGGLATLVLNVSKVGGSGTKTDWAFSLAGTPGANGPGSGDMLAAQNLADVSNKKTAKDNISIHGADVASATTTNLETATGDLIDITGTTTITAITLNDGHERTIRFTGILTLTHGASLVIPGAVNFITAAGDFVTFRGYAAGVVRVVSIQLANAYEEVSTTVSFAAPFAATSGSGGQVWNTVSIPRAGLWEVGGNVGVSKTGGTTPVYTHMHADNNVVGQTTIQTSPGSGTTLAMHVTSNDPNGWIIAHSPVRYRTTGPTTVNFVATTDFTGGTCGFYGRGYAARVAP